VVVARIIRICSAALLALCPAPALAGVPEPSALGLYVRARAAIGAGQPVQAAQSYAAALTADPESTTIAARAYRVAVEAGDYDLALRSLRTIGATDALPADAQILLYIAALRDRDWARAKAQLEVVAKQPGLGFLAPMLGSWLELTTRTPVVVNAGKAVDQRPNAYAAENAALIALARGRNDDALLAIKTLWTIDPYRAGSLRLAAASLLADRKLKDQAAKLLVADDAAVMRARALIATGKPLGISVDSPLDGTAFLLARVAGDLIVEGSARPALSIARLASFAAPGNPRIQLMLAGALSGRGRHAEALAIAETLTRNPVYGEDAASLRIDALEKSGRVDAALAEARGRADRSANDAARVGDIEARRGNHAAAYRAYSGAIARLGGQADAKLIYAAGNAADMAGDWSSARPMLERALALAPDDPVILNELGYGLIANDRDLARGAKLIARAAELQPNNAVIIDSLGWAQFRKGALGEAITLLERAMAMDLNQPDIAEHLGDAYWTAGRRIDARYTWTAARTQAEGEQRSRLDSKIADGLGAR
jgi:tetratricopeptide (TPR) repeat protein